MAEWGFSFVGALGAAALIDETADLFGSEPIVFHVVAGDELRYAFFVETGSGRGPPQPYMRPAVQRVLGFRFQGIVERAWATSGSNEDFRRNLVELTAEAIAEEARVDVPVDTGALRDSIKVEERPSGEIRPDIVVRV